jgi:hypothetical protein
MEKSPCRLDDLLVYYKCKLVNDFSSFKTNGKQNKPFKGLAPKLSITRIRSVNKGQNRNKTFPIKTLLLSLTLASLWKFVQALKLNTKGRNIMTKIKYESIGNETHAQVYTECPYGQVFVKPIKINVASISCQKCPYFIKDDSKNKTVFCSHK